MYRIHKEGKATLIIMGVVLAIICLALVQFTSLPVWILSVLIFWQLLFIFSWFHFSEIQKNNTGQRP